MKLFEDGDPCFAPMLNALFAAFRGTAVMSGCEVSATGTSRTVSITAGSVQINGEVIAVGAGSVTLDAGSTFDRYDLVSVNASGSKIVTKGTTKRKCPTQPANTCLLAIVFVPAGATVIATGDVYDARLLASKVVTDTLHTRTWLVVLGADPLLISKTHNSSTTVTFGQVESGHGNVKVIVKGAHVERVYGTRTFKILKNGIEIWSGSQSSNWSGEVNFFGAYTATAFESLAVATGDVLTISRTGGAGAVTVEIYATPLVAPYGIAT